MDLGKATQGIFLASALYYIVAFRFRTVKSFNFLVLYPYVSDSDVRNCLLSPFLCMKTSTLEALWIFVLLLL